MNLPTDGQLIAMLLKIQCEGLVDRQKLRLGAAPERVLRRGQRAEKQAEAQERQRKDALSHER
ncbi:hypothetical protein OS42_19920 [Dickeya oryzae]